MLSQQVLSEIGDSLAVTGDVGSDEHREECVRSARDSNRNARDALGRRWASDHAGRLHRTKIHKQKMD